MIEFNWSGGRMADEPDEIADALNYLLSVDAEHEADAVRDRMERAVWEKNPGSTVQAEVSPVSHNVVAVPNGTQVGYLVTLIAKIMVDIDFNFD
ncbi:MULTISPECIES: hypothetical protein [Rhodococcus]|nr:MULTISPECIES: hypothetical protein [Rhodococcus]